MSLVRAETVPEPLLFSQYTPASLLSAYSGYEHAIVEDGSSSKNGAWRTCFQRASGAASVPFNANSLASHARKPEKEKNDNAYAFAANRTLDLGTSDSSATTVPPTVAPTIPELPAPAPLNEATRVAVVGVGFVGASLLEEFTRPFPRAIGYDASSARVDQLQKQYQSPKDGKYAQTVFTADARQLRNASYFLIAVPTLLRYEGMHGATSDEGTVPRTAPKPAVDLDYVRSAVQTVLQHCSPGSVIVLESSVSVGTTRSLLGPYSHVIHAGMSPERVDPGRISPGPAAVPKLVSGLTPIATNAIASLYQRCYEHVIPVSSPEVAEMTKLHENCFRMVNIAYANEVADACRALEIDFKEVVDAARTKPYGFMPFSAGLGVGGHCIPVNPYYLFASCKRGTYPLLESATKRMKQRPRRAAKSFHRRVMLEMAKRNGVRVTSMTAEVRPRILVVGLGFKPGSSVLSFSPGVAFAAALKSIGCAHVTFYDPLVDEVALKEDESWLGKLSDHEWLSGGLQYAFDGIAVCIKQHNIDWSMITKARLGQSCYVRWLV